MAPNRPDLRIVPSNGPRTSTAVEDGQLLAAVRHGDVRAAGALCDRMRPTIDRTIARLLGKGDEDHQDLAQQALIELVRTIDRYRGECSLEGWASTLTAHLVYKHIRHRQVERRVFSGPFAAEAEIPAPQAPGREVALRGLLKRILDHLAAMEPNRAWAVTLHDVHGYDLKELAEIMGSTVAAAQTRLSRGRRELHERIARDPELAGALDRSEGGAL